MKREGGRKIVERGERQGKDNREQQENERNKEGRGERQK